MASGLAGALPRQGPSRSPAFPVCIDIRTPSSNLQIGSCQPELIEHRLGNAGAGPSDLAAHDRRHRGRHHSHDELDPHVLRGRTVIAFSPSLPSEV